MPNYNRVILMGNLTRDVELRDIGNDRKVADLSIAINRKYKSGDELKEETTYVDCEAWGNTAENISKFFNKGKPIHVEGRLKLDTWEDKDGGKRQKLKVVVDSFEFVTSGNANGSEGGASAQSSKSTAKPKTAAKKTKQDEEAIAAGAEDIPF